MGVRVKWPYWVGLLLCWLLPAQALHAEYQGRNFSFAPPRFGAELSYRLENEERTGPFSFIRNETQVFGQRFELATDGWLYHPALATYRLLLSPEWWQTREDTNSGTDLRRRSSRLGYGVETTLLPYKPYTIDLYARRQNSELRSNLAQRSELENDAYGARLQLKSRAWPTRVSYDHADIYQTGFFEAREQRDDWRMNVRRDGALGESQLNLSYFERDRDSAGTLTRSESTFGNFSNARQLGDKRQGRLGSALSFRDTSINDRNTSGLAVSERLDWRHRRNLTSNYNLGFTRDQSETLTLDRVSGSAGLSHSLYENLVSSASVFASRSSQEEELYGVDNNFNYQRRIPAGMLFANTRHNYRATNRGVGGTPQAVIGEGVRLSSGDVTLLANEFVDLDTVVVTSADRSRLYVRGEDYSLEVISNSTRISRIPLGAIEDGEVVLVDYVWQSNAPFDDAVVSQTYGIGVFLWSAWRIRYNFNSTRQDFRGGTRPEILTDDTVHTVESELQLGNSVTRAVYESTDRTAGTSLERWRIQESLRFRAARKVFLGAAAYYGETTFKDLDGRDISYGGSADLQWRATTNGRLRLQATYDIIEGRAVNTEDRGVALLWDWSTGIWRFQASYRYLRQEDLDIGQLRQGNSLYLQLHRTTF